MALGGIRRTGVREGGANRTKSLMEEIIDTLKGTSRDKQPSTARISLWNTIFTDARIHVSTDVAQHFLDIMRRHLIRCTTAQRFCFEMAVFLIDMPSEFHRVAAAMPSPYTIAMHIAFRVVHDKVERSAPTSKERFADKVMEEVPPEQRVNVLSVLRSLQNDEAQVDRLISRLWSLISPLCFDLLLGSGILPPHLRLHFALKYGRPMPVIRLDFENLDLPFEFLQSIADIEGEDMVRNIYLGG